MLTIVAFILILILVRAGRGYFLSPFLFSCIIAYLSVPSPSLAASVNTGYQVSGTVAGQGIEVDGVSGFVTDGDPDEVLTEDIALTGIWMYWMGMGTVDILTSLQIAEHPGILSEINPVLGPHPSILSYDTVLPAVAGLGTGVGLALNKRDRGTLWMLAGFGEMTFSVIPNLDASLLPSLFALPTLFVGIGVAIVAGVVSYYIAHWALSELGYYQHPPRAFVSRIQHLKGFSNHFNRVKGW